MKPLPRKPLGHKAYGSIPHLPGSRLGPGDHHISEGQARICTEQTRDKHDLVIVQAKYDGSCCAVARINHNIYALQRQGYLADSSPHEMHHLFAAWVERNESRFMAILKEGERLVGEWLALAHGTIYLLGNTEPWVPFDLMRGSERATANEFLDRVMWDFEPVEILYHGNRSFSLEKAMLKMSPGYRPPVNPQPLDGPEGVVYRVERHGKVDFLAKYVRPDKVDGKYLPEVSGKPPVWNWMPRWWPQKEGAATYSQR